MAKENKIQWLNIEGYTGETWNPILGCLKVSEGCNNCYAEKMARRLSAIGVHQYSLVINPFGKWNGSTALVSEALKKPIQWKAPRVIFVCSMSDLFHESVSFNNVDKVFNTMLATPQHIYIILTKRPEIMKRYFESRPILNNVWLGVSAENQKRADERIPILLEIPARIRFVSIEPMLGRIGLSQSWVDYLEGWQTVGVCCQAGLFNSGVCCNNPNPCQKKTNKLDWVIVGGESGSKARPLHYSWVVNIKKQCEKTNTPFFFKQWGEYAPIGKSKIPIQVGKKEAGRLLDGKEYSEYPRFK